MKRATRRIEPRGGDHHLPRHQAQHVDLRLAEHGQAPVEPAQALAHGWAGSERGLEVEEQALVHLLDHREEQIVLGAEVVVDHPDAGAGGGGDLA